MTNPTGQTFVSLQVLRGLAAWMLVYFHYIQVAHNHKTGWFLSQWISRYGEVGVDIFFVLSGFVMAATHARYRGRGVQYAINRVVRIVPNYWFYTLLLVLSIQFFPDGYITSYTWSTLTDSLLFIPNLNPWGHGFYPTLYPGWTLVYEMFFYLLLATCLLVNSRYSLTVCALVLALIPITPLKELVFLGRGTEHLWDFLAGIVVFQVYTRIDRPTPRTLAWLVLVAAWVACAVLRGDDLLSRLLFSAVLVFGGVLAEPLLRGQGRITGFLRRQGDISYSVYLAHVVVIGWFVHLFGHDLPLAAEIAVIFAMTVVNHWLARLTYEVIESGGLPQILKRLLNVLAMPVTTVQDHFNRRIGRPAPAVSSPAGS